MSLTVCPVTANEVAHLHKWRWQQPPDGIYALLDGTAPISCVHLFDLEIVPIDGDSPWPVCGMGGIITHPSRRGEGHAKMLLYKIISMHLYNDEVQGFILNGRKNDTLWHVLGFEDVGESPTAVGQRLWWLPRPGVELPSEFSLNPGDHW